MPDADGRHVYITRWLLEDGSEKVSRGSSGQASAVGDTNIFPMQADGSTRSGWRCFWRVTASEASTEGGVDAVLTREYVEPAP
jgi:hypothetical protein